MIEVLASGSSGNCYLLHGEKTKLMLDCGINLRKFDFTGVAACLVTHEHSDHTKGIKAVLKAGVPCYMSAGTASKKNVDANIVKAGQQFAIGDFQVLPFALYHDAKEPLGYLLKGCGKKVLFATDTGAMPYIFTGVTHFLVECNHSKVILRQNVLSGRVHPALAKRVARTHFELEKVKDFFADCDLSATEQIYLIHVSNDNGDKDLFKREIQAVTGKPVTV